MPRTPPPFARADPWCELGFLRLNLLAARADLGRGRVPRVARGRGRRELLTPGLVAGPALSTRATMLAGIRAGLGRPPAGSRRDLPRRVAAPGRDRPLVAGEPGLREAPPTSAQLLSSPDPAVIVTPSTNTIEAAGVRRSPGPAGSRELQRQLAASQAVKLVVSRAGVVRVPAESLFAAGMPVGTAASSLRLYREARPIARTVLSADGRTLRPGDAVEFYGYGMDTRYSGSAVYWLTSGLAPERTSRPRPRPSATRASPPSSPPPRSVSG